MSIFTQIGKMFRRREGGTAAGSAPSKVVYVSGSGSGRVFSLYGDQALAVATVYRCVKLLSESVASLRLQYMRKKEGRYQEDENSPLHYLLTVQPQPEMSAFDFWAKAVSEMLLEGNAYIYPRYVMGELTDLVLCHRGSVAYNPMMGTYTITDAWNGVFDTRTEDQMIHLYLYSDECRRGVSVIRYADLTMQLSTAGDEETLDRFRNDGAIRGFVTNDSGVKGYGEYQDTQLESTAESIDSRFQRGERIVSLPANSGFTPLSLSSTDLQLLESRKFAVRDICRFFGVHPSFVFDDTSSNYKSAEMANVAFLSNTLNPILQRIENELTRKLIPRSLCCKRTFRYDRRGIYSLDLASLAAYQKQTIESGIYTINDWRRRENQPTVDGGDTIMVSANLKSLDSWLTDQQDGTQTAPAGGSESSDTQTTDINDTDDEEEKTDI